MYEYKQTRISECLYIHMSSVGVSHVCMYVGRYACMHIARHARNVCLWVCMEIFKYRYVETYMSLCYICMHPYILYACRYVCSVQMCINVNTCDYTYVYMYITMHVYQISTPLCVHIFDITEQKWLPHYKHHPQINHTIWAYRPNIFAYGIQNTTNCNVYFICYCYEWASNKYASQMPICHIYKYIHVHMTQLCQQLYTYILHYWHMLL